MLRGSSDAIFDKNTHFISFFLTKNIHVNELSLYLHVKKNTNSF